MFPWSGKWDDLPAAHAAAIFFDLATMLGLFLVGRRLRPGRAGRDLGIVLAYAWASYPYTLFVLNSNANDSLVAMLLVYSFLALAVLARCGARRWRSPAAAKFAPLALVPAVRRLLDRRLHDALRFFAGVRGRDGARDAAGVLPTAGLDGFWDRTVGFQLGRDSPVQHLGAGGRARPRSERRQGARPSRLPCWWRSSRARRPPLQVAALGAAVLIALELSLTHWFYLYIVWFLPLVADRAARRGSSSTTDR